jgi:hypothetical protein
VLTATALLQGCSTDRLLVSVCRGAAAWFRGSSRAPNQPSSLMSASLTPLIIPSFILHKCVAPHPLPAGGLQCPLVVLPCPAMQAAAWSLIVRCRFVGIDAYACPIAVSKYVTSSHRLHSVKAEKECAFCGDIQVSQIGKRITACEHEHISGRNLCIPDSCPIYHGRPLRQ